MKAVLNDTVIAEAEKSDLVSVEGNWYFPPASIVGSPLIESPTPYTCPWKGACQYFTLRAGGTEVQDGAWSYPQLLPGAVERVGTDFAGYLAFDNAVKIVE